MLRTVSSGRLTPRNDRPPTQLSFPHASYTSTGIFANMPRCEFGTPQEVSVNANAVLAKLPPRLRQILTQQGLHKISALANEDELIITLVNDWKVTTEEEFLYVDAEWPELAAGTATQHPPLAKVQAWVVGMGLTWSNVGSQLQEDQKMVCSRIMIQRHL